MKPAASAALAFAALAFSQSAPALPPGTKGHSDWLPLYGPVENKVCDQIGRKPGDWWTGFPDLAARHIVHVYGNTCQYHFLSINPDTLQPVEFVSGEINPQPKPIAGEREAPAEWWKLPEMQNALLQGEPQIADPYNRGPYGLRCGVRFGSGREFFVEPGMLLIPDLTRAYLVRQKFNANITREERPGGVVDTYGAQGKPYCALELLVELPQAQPPAITVSGGGLHNPGNITVAPARPVTPAAAAAAPIAEMAVPPLVAAFNFLARAWTQGRVAALVENVIVYKNGAGLLWQNREIMGLSAAEVGWINSVATGTEAPTQGEVEAALKALTRPVTEDAIRLSAEHDENGTGGNCGDRHGDMEKRKNLFCRNSNKGSLTCSTSKTAFQNLAIARVNAICARQRDEIMNQCFDGGNRGHQIQSEGKWNAVKNCLDIILRLR